MHKEKPRQSLIALHQAFALADGFVFRYDLDSKKSQWDYNTKRETYVKKENLKIFRRVR